jgi:hypothetical protein
VLAVKNIRLHVDGAPHDGVGHDFASPETLARYRQAADALATFRAPILVNARKRNERLFIAAFDGTGNNKFSDPHHATNVAKIDDAVVSKGLFTDAQVYSRYIAGPGTQENWLVAKADTLLGHSYESNVEEAYFYLVERANRWALNDPDTVVRVHAIGFSRGASQVPGFARVVHERGIPDLASRVEASDGSFQYERYIAKPGEVVQTVGLFDPVATGAPMNFDRRLPPSVVSGFQITAGDELRRSFPSDQILPPGFSPDGRFLNVMVPGAHSDVGGGYLRDGLSVRCGNLMRDYCNALRDEPYLEKVYEPIDQRLNVIHRSWEGEKIFRVDPRVGVRGESTGTNEELAPRHMQHAGPAPHGPEPVNPLLEDGLRLRRVPGTPANLLPDHRRIPPVSPDAVLAAGRSVSFAPSIVRGLGYAGTAADIVLTVDKRNELLDDGNDTGAGALVDRFVSRHASGWVGAQSMMTLGAAAGIETGPGIFVTGAIGAVVGFVAGDKIADHIDRYRVTHQEDPEGNTWRLDEGGQSWIRDIPPLPGTPYGQRFVADSALSDRLNYLATKTAVELALATERHPSDPFTQPSAPGDSPSLKEAPWTHQSDTHQWTRVVADGYLEHGMFRSHVETANPPHAAELNRLAEQTIQQNVAESSLAVAQRYQYAYEQQGWARHGSMPDAVSNVLNKQLGHVLASDGHEYSRGTDGQWATPGTLYGTNRASAKKSEELDLTEAVLPTQLNHPAHPDHEFFQQVRGHVVELDRSLGRAPDHHTDNISSALTVQARADGMKRVDQIDLVDGGATLRAVQAHPDRKNHLLDLSTSVPTVEASTPLEQSAVKWPEAMQQFQVHEQARSESQQRAADRERSLPLNDPRNPGSRNHDLYNELERCLPDASEERLVQFTAACHRHRITAKNLSGLHVDYDSMTLSIDSHDLLSTTAVVDLSTPPPEPQQAIQQIQQFDQQMEQIRQQSQEQAAQMSQQGPVM